MVRAAGAAPSRRLSAGRGRGHGPGAGFVRAGVPLRRPPAGCEAVCASPARQMTRATQVGDVSRHPYPVGVYTHNASEEGGVYGYTPDKDEYLKRLRRIEGQVRGLEKMVEDDKYCIDILTQVSAVTSALQSVALGLLEDHLGHCVTEAAAEGGEVAAAKVREASDAIARLVRS